MCTWGGQEHSRFIRKNSRFLVEILHSCFRKPMLKSKFSVFFMSKRQLGGYFRGNVCFYFQKISIWARQDHYRFSRGTSIFLVAFVHFWCSKIALKSKFSEFFFTSKTFFGGYFQLKACTNLQKICSSTSYSNTNFITEPLIS